MTRRYRNYTRASDVTVIKADTGEIVGNEPAYDPIRHREVVATGQKRSDPSRRRTNHRRHNSH